MIISAFECITILLIEEIWFAEIYIFHSFVAKVRPKIQTLLDSLTELSKLLYLPDHSRSPKLVLRLHNQAFIHAMICKEVIGKSKSLTERKFCGRYWHSITAHAAKQSRIISLKSTNTEEEERHFNTLQGVTRLTNRRPGDIITPSLIRLQAEQKMAESKRSSNPVKMQESQISKYYSTLPPFPNTIIPNRYIIKHPKEYQAHLQSISDFIACGEGVWWKQILSGGTSLSHGIYTCNNQGKEIKTKLCKNVARIVEETDNVYKLDTARQNMKKTSNK